MKIGVLTTGRQDWGILRSTCLSLRADPAFDLRLMAGGMHYSDRFGRTAALLEEEGFVVHEALAWIRDDRPQTTGEECAAAIPLLESALARQAPDALVLLGDRYETLAAAFTAALARVPLVHLHGGEETQGAFDDAFRHAITKLSHLHLVSHPTHAARIVAMGEDPATIHVVGAPGLDNARRADLPDLAELERDLEIELRPPIVLVTLHQTTLGDDPGVEATAVIEAMDEVPATYVITLPNSDPGSAITRAALAKAASRPGRVGVEALGERRYWGLMRGADAMVGNSSSALIEAPVFGLPAVNVGSRQRGRLRGANVIDAGVTKNEIAAGLRQALGQDFRRRIAGTTSPFGDGRAADRITAILKSWIPPHPPIKRPISLTTQLP